MLRSALLTATVLTLTSHSLAHEWFSELRSPTGYKCCGQNDCRPVESRYNARSGQLELRLDRMWVPIDHNKVVREQFSPDGRYYACWRDPNFPYCFVLPPEVQQVVGLAYFLYVGSPASKENDDRLDAKPDELLRVNGGSSADALIRDIDERYLRTHGHRNHNAHAE